MAMDNSLYIILHPLDDYDDPYAPCMEYLPAFALKITQM